LAPWPPLAAPAPLEVLPRIPEVSPPPKHVLHEGTNESHGCIIRNATCVENANVNYSNTSALFQSLYNMFIFLLR
jgi:hypothetical protein